MFSTVPKNMDINVTLRAQKSTRRRRLAIEILTKDEVSRLLDACSVRAPTGRRNRALIMLLYRTGLRISEALDLAMKDINLEIGALVVLHGKGDRRRAVGIDEATTRELERWLKVRRAFALPGGRAPIFCTLQGKRVDPSYVRRLLPRLGKKAGIEKRIHPHGLRHSLASELAAEGLPANLIQKVLGHTSLRTTSRYVDHLLPTEAIDRLKARRWERPRRKRRQT